MLRDIYTHIYLMDDRYYARYIKYKAKYLSLKRQRGGQVVFDPMYDEFVGDNALEEIIIRALDMSSDKQIVYNKIIQVEPGYEVGSIYYYDRETGKSKKYDISRGEIEKLLDNINEIWDIPDNNSESYGSKYSLYVKHGNKVWNNQDNIYRNKKPKEPSRVIADHEDVYQDAVSNILGFE
jgi:hypothetical protein